MSDKIVRNHAMELYGFCISLLVFLLFSTGIARGSEAITVEAKYPDLASGILRSAELEPMAENNLLIADGIKITKAELMKNIKSQEPKLRKQLEKNLFFVLEQEVVMRLLLSEAKKEGIKKKEGDEKRIIQDLFERKTKDVSVSVEEANAFYQANKEMVGGMPFEQVKDGIQQYLLQDKKQQAVASYIASLKETVHLRINEKWTDSQNKLAKENPVDKARNSKKPTMVEFGATGCIPCDMMQPILDNLRKKYPGTLNVVFVHVGEEQILAARYGIQSIPVQVFFDAKGKEVFRHVGFYPEKEVIAQLEKVGLR